MVSRVSPTQAPMTFRMSPRRTGASASAPINLTDDADSFPSPNSSSHSPGYNLPCTPTKCSTGPARSRRAPGSATTLSSEPGQLRNLNKDKPASSARPTKRTPKSESQSSEEKRLRRYRSSCPQAFHEVYERATGQRFYVLERFRVGTPECPEEVVELTGSTGNIYQVHIARKSRCTCPHAEKGNQCKHMVYVLAKVLNAPFNLVYQLAFLSTELQQIFENAPPISPPSSEFTEDKNRKPIEGDCPICFSELEVDGGESVVWCRAACGQNIHRECFGMWARSKSGDTTCPFCRSVWEGDKALLDATKIDRGRGTLEEGYINVRDQLPGVSQARDDRTYSRWSPYYRSRYGPW